MSLPSGIHPPESSLVVSDSLEKVSCLGAVSPTATSHKCDSPPSAVLSVICMSTCVPSGATRGLEMLRYWRSCSLEGYIRGDSAASDRHMRHVAKNRPTSCLTAIP